MSSNRYHHNSDECWDAFIAFRDRFPKVAYWKQIYVYVLRKVGSEEIKYVGVSIYPYKRFSQHFRQDELTSIRKQNWVASLCYFELEMEVLALMEHTEGLRLEKMLIEKYGYEQLVNDRTGFKKSLAQ